MNIITNNQPRHMLTFTELPAKIQAEFDYVGEIWQHHPRFAKYKGHWYDVFDMLASPPSMPGWHSYTPETFFSGVLVRVVDGGDSVIMGHYYA